MLSRSSNINLEIIHYTEEELVALYIQTRQNYYFGLLYGKCSDRVYHHCLFLVKDPAIAQDLTHDIFLKLVTILTSFKEKSRFSTWLASVTHNHCMDQFGLQKRRAEIPIDNRIEIADDTDLINLLENDSIELMNLKNALAHLPSEEKAILFMRYTDDVSIGEIAAKFKITTSAVKMRLLRSRKKLRTRCCVFYAQPW